MKRSFWSVFLTIMITLLSLVPAVTASATQLPQAAILSCILGTSKLGQAQTPELDKDAHYDSNSSSEEEPKIKLPKLQAVSMDKSGRIFDIPSFSAEWSWIPNSQKPDEAMGVAIDALAPWEWDETPTLPAGQYQLKWDLEPDKVRVFEYSSADGTNYEASPAEGTTVNRPYRFETKPGKYYLISATWDESRLKADGRCGSVDYSFRTAT